MATDQITYEKEQIEAIDGFDASRTVVHSQAGDFIPGTEELEITVTYLDVDDVLIKGCGTDCPWMGLFHVELDAADFSEFLSDIARHLVRPLKKALSTAGVEKDYDFALAISKMQIHIWSAPAPPIAELMPPEPEAKGGGTAALAAVAGGSGAPAPAAGGAAGGTPLVTCGALDKLTICLMLVVSGQPMLIGPIWCKPPTGAL